MSSIVFINQQVIFVRGFSVAKDKNIMSALPSARLSLCANQCIIQLRSGSSSVSLLLVGVAYGPNKLERILEFRDS